MLKDIFEGSALFIDCFMYGTYWYVSPDKIKFSETWR